MLSKQQQKWTYLSIFTFYALLQLYSIFNHQLFGDEAFYWLESQHLAWSYTELPAWTQWMIALSEFFFPRHPFFIRLPSLLAALSLPWLSMLIAHTIKPESHPSWKTGLLTLALPLLALAGILAIPDIWVVFFALLAVLFWLLAIQQMKNKWFFALGLTLALGINVHLRFWLIVFIAAVSFIWQFRHHQTLVKRLLLITLPVAALGFLPIVWFNVQHNFPMLAFQLSDRHPWQFQSSHFTFFVVQVLVTTPLVFTLSAATVFSKQRNNQIIASLVYLALFHWLTYAVVGFFSDNLRFNIHWTLFSYVLLLIIASVNTEQFKRLQQWAAYTGALCSLLTLMTFIYWLQPNTPVSTYNQQLTENSRGWQELALKTKDLSIKYATHLVVADNFMTLAELKFYLPESGQLTALSHPLNIKHGRQVQLDIMQYTQEKTTNKKLLVVEHNALKLEQTLPFYLQACDTLNGIKLIDTLDYAEGIKSFYFFETGHGACQLPPITYIENSAAQISGWVLTNKHSLIEVRAEPNSNPIKLTEKDIRNNPLFKGLDPNKYHLNEFSFDNQSSDEIKQLAIKLNGLMIQSQRLEGN